MYGDLSISDAELRPIDEEIFNNEEPVKNEVRVNGSNDCDIQPRRQLYEASNFTTNEQNNYAALRDRDDFNESEPTMGAGAKVEHEITLVGATIGSALKNTSDLHLNE